MNEMKCLMLHPKTFESYSVSRISFQFHTIITRKGTLLKNPSFPSLYINPNLNSNKQNLESQKKKNPNLRKWQTSVNNKTPVNVSAPNLVTLQF